MKSKKMIIISAIVLAVVAALVVFLVLSKKDAYRILKVFELDGEAKVTRSDIGEIDPYVNMVLESGDNVKLNTGLMTLQADDDKYIHLEEGTELVLNAAGDSANSKTTIELKSGAITNDIQNKLSEESYYEVNTPNSTMSVRGTMFRVEVYMENGIKYTKVSVFEGGVASYLVYKDGTKSDREVKIEKGKEVIIYEDDKTVDYVSAPKDIDY
jgi:ferric-dicitrate binding protein FerR (iron transport regulator)